MDDPRAGNVSHRLGDLMVMMVAASLCGATCATEFALFAETRKAALSRLIEYDRAPSHDTFSRLLRILDPEALERAFASFAAGFARALSEAGLASGEVVALDGKALRRAYERGQAASPPLTVSAFAARARLCLAAATPQRNENEAETAIKVVELLDLTDSIVTADALHCHRRMAAAIVKRGGGYLLALKGNRAGWRREAEACLLAARPQTAETLETNHGRRERRRAEVVAAAVPLMAGHAAFVRITAWRDEAPPATRYFMASQVFAARQALDIARSHWRIETGLHWMLDVHLDEDHSRARKDNAPANVALVKRIARNILERADKPRVPISHRIKKCAWSDDYLIQAITHMR